MKAEVSSETTAALASKMEILAWVVRAAPFVEGATQRETLNVYRQTEVPLDPDLLPAYHNAQSDSMAVLSVVDVLR